MFQHLSNRARKISSYIIELSGCGIDSYQHVICSHSISDPYAMKLADSYIDAQEGALLAQDAIAEWLDRYRLELDSQTEQVIYEGIMDALKRADLVELK